MNIESISRGDRILAGISLVLLIDLVAFPWFSPGFGFTFTATDAPDSFFGVLAVLGVIVFIADLAIQIFSPQTQVPSIGGSRAMTRLAIVGFVAACLALKFLLQISHFGDLGWGFWLAAILTGGLVFLAMQGRTAVS